MSVQVEYKHLEPRPRSNYRQLWVKGRHMRAEVLYRYTVGPEPETPQEVADDYDLPVEAVLEAIDYCVRNKELLDAERARDWASIKALGLDKPPYVPPDYKPDHEPLP
jgi:uncharacterized protein (DUF433 family)